MKPPIEMAVTKAAPRLRFWITPAASSAMSSMVYGALPGALSPESRQSIAITRYVQDSGSICFHQPNRVLPSP